LQSEFRGVISFSYIATKQERETLYRLFFVGNELCNILVNVDGQKGKEKKEKREREIERKFEDKI